MPRTLTINGASPSVDPAAFVAEDVVLAGDVVVERGANVWFGCVLRSERSRILIGEDTNLQDLTVVHTDEAWPTTIGRRVTVGHRVILHGCTVDDDALIGMGAVLLNGSRVGEGAIVGAGAVVREGMEVPPRSFAVGVPARILDAETPPPPRSNVAHYLEYAGWYRRAQAEQDPPT